MKHFLAAFALAATLSGAAWAQNSSNQTQHATVEEVDTHTTGSVFPGPRAGETRPVWVWRPANAPATPLPVLYMADGLDGLYIAVAHLQGPMDAGLISPMLVISTDPNRRPEDRAAEYLRGFTGGGDDYRIHERWLIEQVIPWAERTQRAARDREHRFIGGFSNGADLALSMASDHPDIFGGALVHSPVGSNADWLNDEATTQRWVVTGGTEEVSGSVHRGGQLPRAIVQSLQRRGAPLRSCIGRWGHQGRAWRELSPGSIVWLLQLGDPAQVATPRENACVNGPAPASP